MRMLSRAKWLGGMFTGSKSEAACGSGTYFFGRFAWCRKDWALGAEGCVMMNTLTLDHRAPRASFMLSETHGVYALYLKSGSDLPGIMPGEDGLLYIGKAAGRTGFKGRCHFNGKSASHSPRRSLAALLIDTLALVPKEFPHPDGAYKTWGLTLPSERLLNTWMHANLLLAIEPRADAALYEQELISKFEPVLNLRDCPQSEQHERVSAARRRVADIVRGRA